MSVVSARDVHLDVRDYLRARNYIDVELIRMTPRRRDPQAKVATALDFNAMVGNPQATYPSIQVAGTSGKGSVSLALSEILCAAGLSTGLHVSPYLQIATEKTWIDGRYCSAQEFHAACEAVRPAAEYYRYRDDCPTSVHGMASLALSYEAFRRRGIDWCVMETGVGGRFDLVQGLDKALAVITDIGLDHVKALGESRREIAWHKAGIMAGSPRAVAVYDPGIWSVLQAEADRSQCDLTPIVPDQIARVVEGAGGAVLVLELPTLGTVEVPWEGRSHGYPVRNAAVAASAADALVEVGLAISPDAVVQGLKQRAMPGRLEVVQEAPQVVLDGAHNAQKMAALLGSVPSPRGRRVLVIGATGDRHFQETLAAFRTRPEILILTRPLLHGKSVADPRVMAAQARDWTTTVCFEQSPQKAVARALEMAAPEDQVLVTGSLYLVGQVRSRWYPWQAVLRQQNSWPNRP